MSKGVLMLDLKGLLPDNDELSMLSKAPVGGVILFKRNYRDAEQLMRLVATIRDVRSDILIAVDQEGGRVQRFHGGSFTRLPPMGVLGRLYAVDREAALHLTEACGWLMASEVRAFDIDLSLAPVLDLDRGFSHVIGDRSFGDDPEAVFQLTNAFVKGMHEVGMAATGKHFPGHGGVSEDSHIALPKDARSLAEVEPDLLVFRKMIEAGLDAIMPAHVVFPSVDAVPAGFSLIWLQDILRKKLGFNGAIFSDCLTMAAASVSGGFPARAEAALGAGCDMVLVCNHPDGAQEVLSWLEHESYGSDRLAALRASQTVNLEDLMVSVRRQKIRERLEALVSERV